MIDAGVPIIVMPGRVTLIVSDWLKLPDNIEIEHPNTQADEPRMSVCMRVWKLVSVKRGIVVLPDR